MTRSTSPTSAPNPRHHVVILGAGRGVSGGGPSAMVTIGGRGRVLDWLLSSFSVLDGPEIHFVGGYKVDEVLDHYPDIRFYFAETNASWLPGALYFIDDNYDLFRDWFGVTLPAKPSELLLRHCHFGIIRDPVIFDMPDLIPWDNIMWGSDFPHSVGSFPDSTDYLGAMTGKVGDEIMGKVLRENPARFYDLDLDLDLTETPEPV